MIAKEKARKMVDAFLPLVAYNECDCFNQRQNMEIHSIQCALISVNEIIEALGSNRIIYGSEYRNEETDYWETVKEEINKL